MKDRRFWLWALFWLVFWIALGFLDAFQLFTYRLYIHDPVTWEGALRRSVHAWILWWPLMPLVLWLAKQYRLGREGWLWNGTVHLVVAVLVALGHIYVYAVLRELITYGNFLPPTIAHSWWKHVSERFALDLLAYSAILSGFYALEYYRRYRERERAAQTLAVEKATLETLLARAELDALKMQLHPHFLFNTLHAISTQVLKGETEAADRMISRLSEFLRLTLENNGMPEVSLSVELEFLDRYLEIERIRFSDRLKVTLDIDELVTAASVPNLVLQPLVENAIRHGVSADETSELVEIRARREGDELILEVHDDGPGPGPSAGGVEEGMGISNTRARLEHLYGADAELSLRPRQPRGTAAVVRIPYTTFGEQAHDHGAHRERDDGVVGQQGPSARSAPRE